MKRITTVSVIRGEGECQAIVNGIVSDELRRIQEKKDSQHAEEVAKLEMLADRMAARNDLLRKRRNELRERELRDLEEAIMSKRMGPVERVWVRIYAALYGYISRCVTRL